MRDFSRLTRSGRRLQQGLLSAVFVLLALCTANPETRYLVIDLAEGPAATDYPVSFTNAPPVGGWTDDFKTTKLVMRRIPAGTFMMGSPTNEFGHIPDREVPREVTLTEDYYMGVFEVTQKQWERVMGAWPSYFTNSLYIDSRPVEQVSYFDIRENAGSNSAISPNWPQSDAVGASSFVGRLRAKTGITTLDLPTEAQWERAARGGTTTAFNSGKSLTDNVSCPNMDEVGRYGRNHPGGFSDLTDVSTDGGTAKVGSYLPNAWGIYDTHANVWEWCLDWFEPLGTGLVDPLGPDSGTNRVLRGGSWNNDAKYCRSANRNYYGNVPEGRSRSFGFRLASNLPIKSATPSFSPDGGAVAGNEVVVSVTCDTADAVIRYSVNGLDPDETSPTVANGGTVSVPVPGMLRAKAFKDGFEPSETKYATYWYDGYGPPSGMVLIPGGTNEGTDPDFGAYSLTVNSFYMGQYEVTKALWDEVYNWAVTNGYSFEKAGSGKAANHPVHTVNWYDAVKWSNARSEMEGFTPAYYMTNVFELVTVYRAGRVDLELEFVKPDSGYRLPTDMEWVYAARGGLQSKRFPWGDTISHSNANYRARTDGVVSYEEHQGYAEDTFHPTYNDGTEPYTSPVGSFSANGYGLYDMAGSIEEWNYDWHPSYVGSYRVLRGGSWGHTTPYGRVASRQSYTPALAYDRVGFRVVLPMNMSKLAVESAYGVPNPPVGTNTVLSGSGVTASVTTPDVQGATRYLNTGWTGTGSVPASGISNSVTFTITEDSSITWLWQTNYWLEATAGLNGSVDVADGWRAAGAVVEITATPDIGYWFAGWSGSATNDTNPLVLTMNQAHAVQANFMPIPRYPITASANTGGTITPAGNVDVLHGQSTNFVVAATGAFHLARILVDGESVVDFSVTNLTYEYTFENVVTNHTIEAFFNSAPVIDAKVNPVQGVAPLRVSFDLTGSDDLEDNIVRSRIDRTGNGFWDWSAQGAGRIVGEYPTPGVYTSVVEVVDGFGLTDSTSVVITVLGVAPTAQLTATPDNGEAPLSVTLDASSSTAGVGQQIVVYEWDFDGNGTFDAISSTSSVTRTYGSEGSYTAVVRVTDNQGLQDSASVTITVSAPPVPPSVVLEATPQEGTIPLDVVFTATPGDPASASSYAWDFNSDGQHDLTTVGNSVTRRFDEAGSFTVRVDLTDTNGLTAVDSVVINTREASRLRVWLNPMAAKVWGDSVTVHAQTAPGNLTAAVQIQVKHSASNVWANLGPHFVPPANSFRTTWDTTSLTSGDDYHLRALAWDTAGNTVTSLTTTVTLDSAIGRVPGKSHENDVGGVTTREQTFAVNETAYVLVSDGTGVSLPPGAVAGDPTIIVETSGDTTEPNGAARGQSHANANRKVSIDGNPALNSPITIEIPYVDDNNDGIVDGTGIPASTLSGYWYDTVQSAWRRALSSEVDTQAKVVRLRNYHLTEFGLFGEVNLLHPEVGGYLRNSDQPVYTNYTTALSLSDGNKVSYWQSAENPTGPVIFEYGFTNWQGAIITEAVIRNHEGGYYAKDFRIELSMDGSNFTAVVTNTLPEHSDPMTYVMGGVTSRYVRLVIENGYQSNYWALSEFSLKGTLTDDPAGVGMADWWQILHFGHFNVDPDDDSDVDELTNRDEYVHGGDPNAVDTDGDGLPDGWEVQYGFTIGENIADLDSNNNGLSNWQSYIAGINPTNVNARFILVDPAVDGTWQEHEYWTDGGTYTNVWEEEGQWHTNEVVVDPGWYTQMVFNAEQLVFNWDSLTGRRYKLFARTNLLTGAWEIIHEAPGTGGQGSFTNDLDTPVRYYRIGVELE